ncbi:pyrimidine 5'-nucleotidase [Marinicauda algicola]|uniref:Pyrimidine 5'-nucleotidase n=1 Tax=Marinicauda algicola TaxID=2029849 RepID=A0A4V3RYD5_9PROT|nr:pyrimidine 5'-nucleotidase [Marinicauda algicola]TGY90049.1 pyrimidine 5'-nucleotidase [Marinicauda algicola]
MSERLDRIDTWVFDLDNTLYPADTAVMSQVERKMTEYVMKLLDLDYETAKKTQKSYYADYGTTLNGLMKNHRVDMGDFLDFVHDVDHSVITPDPELARHIAALEGRRLVYTNGSRKHAEKVIDQLGLNGLFEDLFDIEASRFTPKPHREGFELFTGRFGLAPGSSVMFEDSVKNLETAAGMGFTTVLVHPAAGDGAAHPRAGHPDIHFAVECLRTFLGEVHTSRRSRRHAAE